jgi:hypothetical protein
MSTRDALATGTDQIRIEITSSATGSTVLGGCTSSMTIYHPTEVTVPRSDKPPLIDGGCDGDDYRDAEPVGICSMLKRLGVNVKHTDTDLYVCMSSLSPPTSSMEATNTRPCS